MSESHDFDLDRSLEMAWDAFRRRLGEVLSVMDESEDLTISVVGATPRIRFTVPRPGYVLATISGEVPAGVVLAGWSAGPEPHIEIDQEASEELAEVVTRTVRDDLGALHPIFLEPDQLAELLSGAADELMPEVTGDFGIVMPKSRVQLDAIVDALLQDWFGHPPLRTEDGDVAMRVGSTMVFLRSTPDFKELVLFSALVHDVAGRSRAVEVLNDLNVESRYCRFALHRDRVFAQISVPAQPFVPAHLKQALEGIWQVADGIDDELADRLRGRTTFPG